ncbi:MAG: hypothetical protein IJ848_00175 [Alphaproteobacteria bacterium]|nr:hypothetical protein [Alphaproteobacteria bacterium]
MSCKILLNIAIINFYIFNTYSSVSANEELKQNITDISYNNTSLSSDRMDLISQTSNNNSILDLHSNYNNLSNNGYIKLQVQHNSSNIDNPQRNEIIKTENNQVLNINNKNISIDTQNNIEDSNLAMNLNKQTLQNSNIYDNNEINTVVKINNDTDKLSNNTVTPINRMNTPNIINTKTIQQYKKNTCCDCIDAACGCIVLTPTLLCTSLCLVMYLLLSML